MSAGYEKPHVGGSPNGFNLTMGSEEDDGGKKSKPVISTCEWTPDAVSCLLEKYGEKYRIGKGLLRNTDWEEVAQSVNSLPEIQGQPKTVKRCRDKMDSLKRRYKTEKIRLLGGGASGSAWVFFNKMDEILSSVSKPMRIAPKQAVLVSPVNADNHNLVANECEHMNGSSDRADDDSLSTPTRDSDSISDQDGSCQKKEKTQLDGSETESSDDDESDIPSPNVEGIPKKKLEQLSDTILNMLAKKRQQPSSHPIQALADAIVGFSDVYARIELAKMEVYTDLQLDIAKLQSRGGSRKRKKVLPSFSGSEIMK
jgi:hypothetical protein